MIYSLHIEATDNPGMLEKILQTARIRGFNLRSLELRTQDRESRLKLHMTVESERPEERLITQLRKLPGVQELTALHAITEQRPPSEHISHGKVAMMYPL